MSLTCIESLLSLKISYLYVTVECVKNLNRNIIYFAFCKYRFLDVEYIVMTQVRKQPSVSEVDTMSAMCKVALFDGQCGFSGVARRTCVVLVAAKLQTTNTCAFRNTVQVLIVCFTNKGV